MVNFRSLLSVASLFPCVALTSDTDDISLLQVETDTSRRIFWSDYTLSHAKTPEEFRAWGESLRDEFENADPWPSMSLDGFFDAHMLQSCEQAMLSVPLEEWIPQDTYTGGVLSPLYGNKYRIQKDQWALSDPCKQLANLQDNEHWLQFLKGLTGEEHLIGLAEGSSGGTVLGIANGGWLEVHTDYNVYPSGDHTGDFQRFPKGLEDMSFSDGNQGGRIVTMMLYVNTNWNEDWGGDLEIWEQVNKSDDLYTSHHNPVIQFHSKIAPLANRGFVWRNTPNTYHGHPKVVTAPNGKIRIGLQYIWFRPQPLVFPPQGGVFMMTRDSLPDNYCENNTVMEAKTFDFRAPKNDCYFSKVEPSK